MPLRKLDDLISVALSGKGRHAPLPDSEGTWQTFYAVWKALGQFIKEQCLLGKGVYLKDFGAFSFLLSPADDQGHYSKTPIFLLHEKFASEHGVKAGKNVRISSSQSMSIFESKPYVPLVTVNNNTIAYLSGQDARVVKQLIDAVITNLVDVVRAADDVEIDFGVAKFRTTARVASIEYNKELLNTVSQQSREYKPVTHQSLSLGQYKGRMSEYWNDRNASTREATLSSPTGGAAAFVKTIDRSHLLGVPKRGASATQKLRSTAASKA